MENVSPDLVGQLFSRSLFLSLIHAIFLRLAAQWIAKVRVPYARAVGLTFLTLVVGGLFSFFTGKALLSLGLSQPPLMIVNLLSSLVVVLAVASGVYGTAIKDEGGIAIGIRKGFLTALVHMAIGLAIALLLMGIIIGGGLLMS